MIEHTDRQTDRQTDRPTDRQTDRAWHAWIMWCDERSIHSTAERGLSASLSGPMARRADCRWLTQPTGLACSPTDFAASRSAHPIAHCPLACLCLLSYACLLMIACSCLWLHTMALPWLFPRIDRPFAWTNGGNGSTGLIWAPMGIVGSVLTRTHMSISSAMGPQAISGRFETFWHADGLNVQPERSERF